MVRITISIPEELKDQLEETAKEENRGVSWIAREIIQEYYNKKEKLQDNKEN